MPPRKRLGQLLTELGVIDEHQLQSALGHQKQWGGKLGAILVQKGFCAEDDVVFALTKHLGMQRVRLAEAKVDPRALKCVSKQIAEKLHVLPYEISGSGRSEVVTIAMSDPTDLSAVDQLAFHTGKRIKPMLAGDGEIVAAIHAYYGGSEEKKEPTDKVARPAPPQAVAAQGTPAGSVAGFPKRIDPRAAATAGGAVRAAPYIPPPIPMAKPAAPAQQLEEIEPDEGIARPRPPPHPIVPPPLDLPEDDGEEFGLEPIAAHSQFGDDVAGQEEVAGEGAAGDEVEGLVSASLAHAGAAEARQMDGLDAIAAQEPAAAESSGWTGPILAIESATASGSGWAKRGKGQTGWDVSAPIPAGGWGAEPAAAPSDGWRGPAAAEGWGNTSPAPGSEVQGWSSPESGGEADSPGEALPPEAILGTAPILVPAASGVAEPHPAEQDAAAAPMAARDAERGLAAPPSSSPPIEIHDATSEVEAEAPDAWGSSEDPLAAQASLEDPLAAQAPAPDPLAAPGAFGDPLASAGSGEDGPSDLYGSTDEFANPTVPPAEETAAGQIGVGSEAADAPPDEEAEAPQTWHDSADQTDRIDAPPMHDPGPVEESAAGFEGQGETDVPRWAAPTSAAEAQESGWIGEALEGGTPLSPADLGTLASIGLEPSDGVGALRLLAVLIRILNRNQLIEPGDLREEIRESRAEGAAAAAAHAPNDMESQGTSSAATEAAET